MASSFKRWLLGSAALFAFINLGVTALTLLSGVYIARNLDGQQYGQYAYMANVFLLMTLFCGFGLTGQVSKDVAGQELAATLDFQERLNGLVALRIVTAMSAALVGCGLFLIDNNPVYVYAGIGAAYFMCSDFLVGILSGYKRYKRIAPMIAAQPGVFAALIVLFGASSVEKVYLFFLISQFVSVVMGLALVLTLPGVRFTLDIRTIHRLNWRTMVAGQIYFIILLQAAYGSYGIALAGSFKQFDTAGELSIALAIVRLLPLLVGTLMSVLYFPQLCALHQSGSVRAFRTTASRMLVVVSIVAAGCAALLWASATAVVPFIYTNRHAAAIPLVQILAITMLFGVADQVVTWVLVASNQAWKALLPLVVRMVVMAFTWPLAFLSAPSALPQLIAFGYVMSSGIGWFIQLHYQRRALVVLKSVDDVGELVRLPNS